MCVVGKYTCKQWPICCMHEDGSVYVHVHVSDVCVIAGNIKISREHSLCGAYSLFTDSRPVLVERTGFWCVKVLNENFPW